MVSVNGAGTDGGNADSTNPTFSPDGSKILFTSQANNLGPADLGTGHDVYLRDLSTGTTTLISVNASGTTSANQASFAGGFSPDGHKVLFISLASNLGPPDTNGESDVYIRDLDTGTLTLVSVNASGTASANGRSTNASFSADGTSVVFDSEGSNLVPLDTNGAADVYVRNLVTGTTSLVSVDAAGTNSGSGASSRPVLNDDGTQIAFQSLASNFGPTDTNGGLDVYLRDLAAGTTSAISVNAAGIATGDSASLTPRFSPDGARVAFVSRSADFGTVDTNHNMDVYVRELATATTRLMTANAAGTDGGNNQTMDPGRFSQDGTKLVFLSPSSDLTPNDTNLGSEVFVYDFGPGTRQLVSINSAGTGPANAGSLSASLSPDGTRVAFSTAGYDYGPTDTNATADVYVRDLAAGTTTLVSTKSGGDDGANGESRWPWYNPAGTKVVFTSLGSNFGANDANGFQDIYLAAPG